LGAIEKTITFRDAIENFFNFGKGRVLTGEGDVFLEGSGILSLLEESLSFFELFLGGIV
jgi:hypothetical protein